MIKRLMGHSLLEMLIVILIMAIVFPVTFELTGKIYTHFVKINNIIELKNSADNICLKMQRDIRAGGKASVDPDFRGIVITGKNFTCHYRFRQEKFEVTRNRKTLVLNIGKLDDVVILPGKDSIFINMIFDYSNINKHRPEKLKVIRELTLK